MKGCSKGDLVKGACWEKRMQRAEFLISCIVGHFLHSVFFIPRLDLQTQDCNFLGCTLVSDLSVDGNLILGSPQGKPLLSLWIQLKNFVTFGFLRLGHVEVLGDPGFCSNQGEGSRMWLPQLAHFLLKGELNVEGRFCLPSCPQKVDSNVQPLWPSSKSLQIINAGEGVETMNPPTWLVGVQSGVATTEKSMEVPSKTRNGATV